MEHDLVDQLRLIVFPIVLGTGDRLFSETTDSKPLRLVDSGTIGAGLTYVIYERASAR
jgi:dihydrofolate reductase